MKRLFYLLSITLLLLQACSLGDNSENKLTIGQEYQGGMIFYIDASGKHGLIASYSTFEAKWGCGYSLISGANSDEMGAGNQNTIDIVNGCSEVGIAAKLCSDLVAGGYSDWYLPSASELGQLYINRFSIQNIGGMTSSNHWSSTQSSTGSARYRYFGGSNTLSSTASKNYAYKVNPIRAF